MSIFHKGKPIATTGTTPFAISDIVQQTNAGIKDLEDKRVESINSINNTKTNSINAINTTTQNNINNIKTEGANQIALATAQAELATQKAEEAVGVAIGTYLDIASNSTYIPSGYLLRDGAEYSKAQFESFYDNWLTTPLYTLCGYMEIYSSTIYKGFDAEFIFKIGDNITSEEGLIDYDGYHLVYISDGKIKAYTSEAGEVEFGDAVANTEFTTKLVCGDVITITINDVTLTQSIKSGKITLMNNSVKQCSLLSSSLIDGNALYVNGRYNSSIGYAGSSVITEIGTTHVGANLKVCSRAEYNKQIENNGFCDSFGIVPKALIVSSNTELTVSGEYSGVGETVFNYMGEPDIVELADHIVIDNSCTNTSGVVTNFENGGVQFTIASYGYAFAFGQAEIHFTTGDDVVLPQNLITPFAGKYLAIFNGKLYYTDEGFTLSDEGEINGGTLSNEDIICEVEPNTEYYIRLEPASSVTDVKALLYKSINNEQVGVIFSFLPLTGSGSGDAIDFDNCIFGYNNNDKNYSFLGSINLIKSYQYSPGYEEYFAILHKMGNWYQDSVISDPSLYGLTVTGTPNEGDTITVTLEYYFKAPLANPNNRVLVEKKEPTEADPTWYNLYNDGWCEQGGNGLGGSTTAGVSNELIYPYLDANYSLIASISTEGTLANTTVMWVKVAEKTAKGFIAQTGHNASTGAEYTYSWEAKGYTNQVVEGSTRPYVVVANGELNQSDMDWSQWATSLEGKVDKGDMIPCATIIEWYESGTEGYVLYSNNYCEQWGKAGRTAVSQAITLFKPYRDVNYGIMLQPYHTALSTDGRPPLVYNAETKSDGFTLNIYTGYAGAYWRTYGFVQG